MVLKLKPKLDLNLLLKGSKTINITKRSKKQKGINTSKSYISFSLHRNKEEILMYYDNKEHIASSFVVCFKHCIDIINARSIEKAHLNVFITKRLIKKLFPFGIK